MTDFLYQIDRYSTASLVTTSTQCASSYRAADAGLLGAITHSLTRQRGRKIRGMRKLWGWIKAALAVLFWAVIVEILHHFGWFPEKWIAELIIKAPSQTEQIIFLWSLISALSGALLFVEHWLPKSWHFWHRKKSAAEILYRKQGWTSKLFARLFPPTMMPMAEAVKYLSDALQGTKMEQFARKNFGDDVGRFLTIFAGWICRTSIPVFVKIPASIVFREFDKSRLGQGRFRSAVSEFWMHGERAPAYTDISIKRRHLGRAIEEVKSWDDQFPEGGFV